jgi:hypothetical protein
MHLFLRMAMLSLSVGAAAASAAEPALQWKFTKRQEYKYLLKHREVRTVGVGDKQVEAVTQSEYAWKWTVTDIDDQGVASLEQKWTALRVNATANDFDFRYDSGMPNKSDRDYHKKLIHLLDQLRFFGSYTWRLKTDGTVAEVRGLSKLLDEHDPGMNILDFHAVNLRDDAFGWFVQQALGRLPPGNGTAKTWQAPVDRMLANLGRLSGKTDFARKKQLREGERVLEEIGLDGKQAIDLDMTWLGAPLRGKLETTKLSGTVRFDASAGAVDNSAVTIDMKGDLRFGRDNPATFHMRYQHTLELQKN